MVPVRAVEINQVPNEHGTTISIVLTMKEVLVADPKTFTTQVFTLSGQTSPQNPRLRVKDRTESISLR